MDSRRNREELEGTDLMHSLSHQTTSSSRRKPPRWWRIYWFRGMWRDVKRRAPYYGSDLWDAWDYRVVPATVYMYFAKYAVPRKISFTVRVFTS